jgi:hypothetical protein
MRRIQRIDKQERASAMNEVVSPPKRLPPGLHEFISPKTPGRWRRAPLRAGENFRSRACPLVHLHYCIPTYSRTHCARWSP